MQRKDFFLSTSTKHEAVVHIIFFLDLTQLCMLIFSDTDHNWIKHSAKQIQSQIAINLN